jgi:hypothetical protein
VPINTQYKLDPVMTKEYMADTTYIPYANGNAADIDYTFTGVIRPMKLVVLRPAAGRLASEYVDVFQAGQCVGHGPRRRAADRQDVLQQQGHELLRRQLHVSPKEGAAEFGYSWNFVDADSIRLVVTASRLDPELNKQYVPQQIKLQSFTTPKDCQLVLFAPIGKPWPITCDDIAGRPSRTRSPPPHPAAPRSATCT